MARRTANQTIVRLRKPGQRKPKIAAVSGRIFSDDIPNGEDRCHFEKGLNDVDIYRMADFIRELRAMAATLGNIADCRFWGTPDGADSAGGSRGQRLLDRPRLGLHLQATRRRGGAPR